MKYLLDTHTWIWWNCKLIEKGRLEVSYNPEDWIQEALKMIRLRLVKLTPRIAYKSTVLPGSFHNDPADQIIVATAREEDAIILTKDEKIQDYEHTKTIW